MKADLFSTGLETSSGILLVDPFVADWQLFEEAIGSTRVAGIVVTNANHARGCAEFSAKFAAAIFADGDARPELPPMEVIELAMGNKLADEVTVVRIEGAAPGEIAIHSASAGGTLIVGDALINFGDYGFTFLPAKYCSNAKQMRKSLRQLLNYRFERLLFAHGTPILEHGCSRLAELLGREG